MRMKDSHQQSVQGQKLEVSLVSHQNETEIFLEHRLLTVKLMSIFQNLVLIWKTTHWSIGKSLMKNIQNWQHYVRSTCLCKQPQLQMSCFSHLLLEKFSVLITPDFPIKFLNSLCLSSATVTYANSLIYDKQ